MANEVFFPDGFWGDYPGGLGDSPSAPAVSVSVSGTTATITFDGDDGVTNYLFYKAAGESAWTVVGNRAADGDISKSDLSAGVRYTFVGYSWNATGGNSGPSITLDVLIQVSTTSTLDGVLAAEADTFLAAFGEAVTYYPKGGGSRDIIAVVDRNPVAGIDGVPHGNTSKLVVKVKNDSDDGISSSEVETGGDKIKLSVRIGKTASQKRINSIHWHDYGMMYLGVA